MKQINITKKIYSIVFFIALFSSCKKEKLDSLPEALALANRRFNMTTPFEFSKETVDFNTETIWINAKLSDTVNWKVTITGLESGAKKILTGLSDTLDIQNTLWKGDFTNQAFFATGEKAVAVFSITGSTDTWSDTCTIQNAKTDYGKDVIIWWDMDKTGVAKSGSVSWFNFFDTGEKVIDTIQKANNPIQNLYRSFQGVDGKGPSNYYIGGLSHSPLLTPVGFDNSLNNIYFNFYARKRTATSNMGFDIVSKYGSLTSTISYTVGPMTWDGWKLISVKLSDMSLKSGNPAFVTSALSQVSFYPYIVSNPGVDNTGFDIDFICFTQDGPFDPSK